MPLCAVLTCKHTKDDPKGFYCHRFPTDIELREKWVEMTGRENWVPTPEDFICSHHFRDQDYIVKRSGNKYLKISALPCEYVVYRNIYAGASNNAAVDSEQPSSFAIPAPAPAFDEEPDSTFAADEWEPNRRAYYLGQRLSHSMCDDDTQVGSSSEFDGEDPRHLASSTSSYPSLDLQPHLQQLPPPMTPEPPALSPEQQLENINRILSRRRSSRKAVEAKEAEIKEVLMTKILLQSGQMTDMHKATAIITIQTRQIEKLIIKHRRLKKTLKRISAMLRNVEISFYFLLYFR